MSYNKNVVEEALFQIKNLEETLQENAKGILQSTMSEEIKQLVKESLKESKKGKGVDEQEEPMTGGEAELDTETEVEDEDMDVDMEADADLEDAEMDVPAPPAPGEEEMDMEDADMEMDDEETVDLTGASDEEVLRVFKAMGDNDGVVVTRDNNIITLTDDDDEYIIKLNESMENFDETAFDSELEEMYEDGTELEEEDEDMEYSFDDEEDHVEHKNKVDKRKQKRFERAIKTKDISLLVDNDEFEDNWN